MSLSILLSYPCYYTRCGLCVSINLLFGFQIIEMLFDSFIAFYTDPMNDNIMNVWKY